MTLGDKPGQGSIQNNPLEEIKIQTSNNTIAVNISTNSGSSSTIPQAPTLAPGIQPAQISVPLYSIAPRQATSNPRATLPPNANMNAILSTVKVRV